MISPQLVADLTKSHVWSEQMRRDIIGHGGNRSVKCITSNAHPHTRYEIGSVQAIMNIPDKIKQIYKQAHEMDQYKLIDLVADRGPYVCQSQSVTLYGNQSDITKLVKKTQLLRFNGVLTFRTRESSRCTLGRRA